MNAFGVAAKVAGHEPGGDALEGPWQLGMAATGEGRGTGGKQKFVHGRAPIFGVNQRTLFQIKRIRMPEVVAPPYEFLMDRANGVVPDQVVLLRLRRLA